MNIKTKEQILSNLKITQKTKSFLSNMDPNFGHMIKNEKKEHEDESDFIGWARLTDGTVVHIIGNIKETKGKLSMPLRIVEVPASWVGDESTTKVEVPNYKSNADKFLEK